jgi:vacuolar protein sorting-associated protein 53
MHASVTLPRHLFPHSLSLSSSTVPPEQALSKAALVQSRLRTQLRETRDEIGRLTALLAKDQSANRVQAIHELIIVRIVLAFPICALNLATRPPSVLNAHASFLQELLGQTTRIKEKALESETIVKEITRDIQTLDKGKKNLTGSITVLRRLQMLGVYLGCHSHRGGRCSSPRLDLTSRPPPPDRR